MALLKAPLFSLGASGQLGKALVYFGWKGLAAVRSHVVPANPNTAAQAAQRSYMTDAVAEWHDASYSADDISAWNRLANLAARARSGFNRMVQEYISEILLGNTWEQIGNVLTFTINPNDFDISVVKASAGNAPTARYGTSPTNLSGTLVLSDQGGDLWQDKLTGLAASTLYYFTIDVGASGTDWGRTGIYTQRTPA